MSEWQTENLKGAIQLGGQTVKSLELVNGAAAIAVLTFYGNLISKGASSSNCEKATATVAGLDSAALKCALTSFALGVASAVLCSILGYVSQLVAATQTDAVKMEINIRLFAVGFGIVSAGLFVLGIVSASGIFK